MANEFQSPLLTPGSASSIRCAQIDAAGQIWNTAGIPSPAYEAYNDSHLAGYGLAVTETWPGYYFASAVADGQAGPLYFLFFASPGGAPLSDLGVINWNGSAQVLATGDAYAAARAINGSPFNPFNFASITLDGSVFTVQFFVNGALVTSGITIPKITVTDQTGTVQVNAATLSTVGSEAGTYSYTLGTAIASNQTIKAYATCSISSVPTVFLPVPFAT